MKWILSLLCVLAVTLFAGAAHDRREASYDNPSELLKRFAADTIEPKESGHAVDDGYTTADPDSNQLERLASYQSALFRKAYLIRTFGPNRGPLIFARFRAGEFAKKS